MKWRTTAVGGLAVRFTSSPLLSVNVVEFVVCHLARLSQKCMADIGPLVCAHLRMGSLGFNAMNISLSIAGVSVVACLWFESVAFYHSLA